MALAERIHKLEQDGLTAPSHAGKRRLKWKLSQKWTLPVVGMLLCLTVGNVIVQGLVVDKNYQIRHWQKLINEQEREMIKLKMDIARLESFDRVQSIAKNELGMRTAEPQDYRLIPAVPAEPAGFAPNPGYIASGHEEGLVNRVVTWLGEIGKTMANTP